MAAKATDDPRDRRWVTLAGLAPDLDGLGLVADIGADVLFGKETTFYLQQHHFWFHGIFGAILVALAAGALARRRRRVAALALLVFHLHLLCDLVGSRGPDAVDVWPIFYLGPFTRDPMWIWSGQWPLDGWQNKAVTVAMLIWMFRFALQEGHSVVGIFSPRADRVFVGTLRKWAARFRAFTTGRLGSLRK